MGYKKVLLKIIFSLGKNWLSKKFIENYNFDRRKLTEQKTTPSIKTLFSSQEYGLYLVNRVFRQCINQSESRQGRKEFHFILVSILIG